MSITFATAVLPDDADLFFLECLDGAVRDASVFCDYGNARDASDLHGLSCEVCDGIGAVVERTGAASVNVSSWNCAQLFSALGLPTDGVSMSFGEIGAAELYDRAVTALCAAEADTGAAATRTGNVTHCGRRPGWLHEKLSEVATVAAAAKECCRSVVWS